MAENITYTLGGTNLRTLGIYVSESNGLLDLPKLKKRDRQEWTEYHGEEADLDDKRYEARDITLKCFMVASDNETLATQTNTLNKLMDTQGLQTLVVQYGTQRQLTYNVYVKEATNYSKRWVKLSETRTLVATFDLKLHEPVPFANTTRVLITLTHPDGTTLQLPDASKAIEVTNARQSQTLLGADTLSLTINSQEVIEFAIGDTISAYGQTYRLNNLPSVRKMSETEFEYTLTLEGLQYDLLDAQFILNIAISVSDAYTGTFAQFVTQILYNANRASSHTWTATGQASIKPNEYKTLNYTGQSCLAALQDLCTQFEAEFSISQSGSTVTLTFSNDVGRTLPYTFKYGRHNGLYSLQRSNVNNTSIVTRLFAYGSTDNLPASEPYSRLLLSGATNRLNSYIEDTSAKALYGVKEAVINYDDIKPERTGTITSITDCAYNEFVDSGMDFDINEKDTSGNTLWLIDGTTAKITMQTGNLAGYCMEINSYNHTTKKFKVVPYNDENNYAIPSETSAAFQFAVGDTYIISDIRMPSSYVTAARTKLRTRATADLNKSKHPQVQYALDIDRAYLKSVTGTTGATERTFLAGDYVVVQDTDLGITNETIRITEFTRNLLDPYDYTLTIGETVSVGTITRIIESLSETKQVLKTNDITDARKAYSSWQAQKEVLEQVFDTEGDYFSEKIKPASIETSMLAVGARSQQLLLNGITIEANVGNNANSLKTTAGSITNYGVESTQQTWQIEAGSWDNLSAGAFYLYAKVKKGDTSTAGVILPSQSKYKFWDETTDPNYYYFLLGTLSSEMSDSGGTRPYRIISLTYGATTINGRYIRTGIIQSSNGGASYWDIDNNKWYIGNADHHIDFGVTAENQFTLYGVKLLSGSGDTADIGVYRGTYNSSYTYYKGDEVKYTVSGATSTYRYINDTQASGKAPTNTTYWTPVATGKQGAKGDKGDDGTSFTTKGEATDSMTAPTSPSIGDFWYDMSQIPAVIKQWSGTAWSAVTMTVGDAYKLESSGHLVVWSGSAWTDLGSIQGTDGYNIADVQLFQRAASRPDAPSASLTYTFSTGSISGTTGSWSTDIPDADGNPCWVTKAHVSARTDTATIDSSEWGTATKMAEDGEDGEDGDDGADGESETYVSIPDMIVPVKTGTDGDTTTEQKDYTIQCLQLKYGDTPVPLTSSMCSVSPSGKFAYLDRLSGTTVNLKFEIPSGISLTSQAKDYTINLGGTLNGVNRQASIVVHVVPSAQGNQGDSIAAPYQGEYSATKTYYGNSTRRDVVKYNGVYYIANKVNSGSFTGKVPTDTSYWTNFGAQFDSIATGLLLAENATIAGFIFRNSRLESHKTLDDGTTPMVLIDGNNGFLKFGSHMKVTEDRVEISNDDGQVVTKVIAASVGDESSLARQKDATSVTKTLVGEIATYAGSTASIGWLHPTTSNIYKLTLGALKKGDKVDINSMSYSFLIPSTSDGATLRPALTLRCVLSKLNITTQTIPSDAKQLKLLSYSGTATSGSMALASNTTQTSIEIEEDGTYYIYIYRTLGYFAKTSGVAFGTDETVTIPAISVNIIYAIEVPNQTVVGNDGIATCWGQKQYMMATADKFIVMYGSYGIKVSTEGIQYTKNGGSTWPSL